MLEGVARERRGYDTPHLSGAGLYECSMVGTIVQSRHAADEHQPSGAAADAAPPRREPVRPRMAILFRRRKLFRHGYHAVSIRQIAGRPSVPLALVGYYFGPRTSCSTAIFEHWSHPSTSASGAARDRGAPPGRRLEADRRGLHRG